MISVSFYFSYSGRMALLKFSASSFISQKVSHDFLRNYSLGWYQCTVNYGFDLIILRVSWEG